MLLIMTTYKKPIEIVDKYLAAHHEFLDEGYKNNYFIVSGPKSPRTGGVIISQLKDRALLEQIIKKDPFIINDLVQYGIIEFTPVKYHRNFSGFVE